MFSIINNYKKLFLFCLESKLDKLGGAEYGRNPEQNGEETDKIEKNKTLLGLLEQYMSDSKIDNEEYDDIIKRAILDQKVLTDETKAKLRDFLSMSIESNNESSLPAAVEASAAVEAPATVEASAAAEAPVAAETTATETIATPKETATAQQQEAETTKPIKQPEVKSVKFDLSKVENSLEEALKNNKMLVNARGLNVRDANGNVVDTYNTGKEVTLTGNVKKLNDIVFVEIEGEKYVAMKYLDKKVVETTVEEKTEKKSNQESQDAEVVEQTIESQDIKTIENTPAEDLGLIDEKVATLKEAGYTINKKTQQGVYLINRFGTTNDLIYNPDTKTLFYEGGDKIEGVDNLYDTLMGLKAQEETQKEQSNIIVEELTKEKFNFKEIFNTNLSFEIIKKFKESNTGSPANIIKWLSKFPDKDIEAGLQIHNIQPNIKDGSVKFSFDDKGIDAAYNRNLKVENCIVNGKLDMNLFLQGLQKAEFWKPVFDGMIKEEKNKAESNNIFRKFSRGIGKMFNR